MVDALLSTLYMQMRRGRRGGGARQGGGEMEEEEAPPEEEAAEGGEAAAPALLEREQRVHQEEGVGEGSPFSVCEPSSSSSEPSAPLWKDREDCH